MDVQACERRVAGTMAALANADLSVDADLFVMLTDLTTAATQLATTARHVISTGFRNAEFDRELAALNETLLHLLRKGVAEINTRARSMAPQSREQLRTDLVAILRDLALQCKEVISFVNERVEGAPETTRGPCERCSACGGHVEESKAHLHVSGRCLHLTCMGCVSCRKQVDAQQFTLTSDGKPLCVSCAPVCCECHAPVLFDRLDRLERVYHSACLRCQHCRRLIAATKHVYERNKQPVCAGCVSRDSIFYEVSPSTDSHVSPIAVPVAAPAVVRVALKVMPLPKAATSAESMNVRRPAPPPPPQPSTAAQAPVAQSSQAANKIPLDTRPLDAVLASSAGIDQLCAFCVDDYSIHKLLFWLDVQQFRRLRLPAPEMHAYAKGIFNKYLGDGAELAMDIPADVRTAIVAGLASSGVSMNIFDAAQARAYEMLQEDIFPRFFYSEIGQRYFGAQSLPAAGPPASQIQPTQQPSLATPRASQVEREFDTVQDIIVCNFEKRYDTEKFYAYEMRVWRLPADSSVAVEDAIHIFRRYSQFFQLHQTLRIRYPAVSLPPFPPRIFLGRSHVKRVSQERLANLNTYMKGLTRIEVLQSSPDLLDFLRADEDDLSNHWFNKRLSLASGSFAKKYH